MNKLPRSARVRSGSSRECPCRGRRPREKSGHAEEQPRVRDLQIGVRSIDNDKAPAVPLACAGTQCMQLARLLRFPPELSKDSHRRRLGGAWERALCQYGGDCGGRIGDRACIGPVEGTEKSPVGLRDCLVGLRLRSCQGEKGTIQNSAHNFDYMKNKRCIRNSRHRDLSSLIQNRF